MLDNTVLPAGYVFQAMPYPWLALALAFVLGAQWHLFPISGPYDPGLIPAFSWTFISSLLYHWFLPFLTVFLVSLGGRAIGMRNLVIYELENDSSRYLRALGASERVIRRYAYRNASLPQLSGLALALGVVVGGNIVTEYAFGYPGLGRLIFQAISNQDYFLLQGIFIEGTVTFEGADISRFTGSRLRDYYRNVQGVFQDPFSSYNPIYRADRVFELIRSVYFAHLPHQAWQAKIESALQAVALNPGDVLGKYPHQLSGGQQQRLLIARALLLDVRLLVADEIISMLDASTRVDILNLLISLKRSGLAILFITHDLSLGNYVSDRTVILRHGAIVEMGDTVKVFTNPRHPYTRDLLAAVPELHKKWEPLGSRPVLSTGTAPPPGTTPQPPALRAPALTECEPGHLVAEEEPGPVLTVPPRQRRHQGRESLR